MLKTLLKTTLACTLAAGLTPLATAQDNGGVVAAPGTAPLQKPIGPRTRVLDAGTGPKYDNRWEIFGGLNFMNGQAGQTLPKRYNLGGGEAMVTYWLGTPADDSVWKSHLGLIADYRFEAGTTPVFPIGAQFGLNRVLVMQHIGSAGINWRGYRNRIYALDYHATAGATYGIFDYAVTHYPRTTQYPNFPPVSACPAQEQSGQVGTLGLYCNGIAPFATAGGSIDFTLTRKTSIRFQPDILFEHFGTETREFFTLSGGLLYKFGK